MKIRAIIFGATGMVGGATLNVALGRDDVESVLVIGRRPCRVSHPKMTEILHDDFQDFSKIEDRLKGYNACFFALGISSFRMSEADYSRITYDFAVKAGEVLARLNPDLVFCFVSGMGADATRQSSQMWARVKGRAEEKLKSMPFKNAFVFRPAYIHPDENSDNVTRLHRVASVLYPVYRTLFPRFHGTATQIADGMINSVTRGGPNLTFEAHDIVALAEGRPVEAGTHG